MPQFNTPRRRSSPPQKVEIDGLRGEIHHLFHGDGAEKGKSFKIMLLRADKTQRAHDFNTLKRENKSAGSVWPQYSKFVSTVKAKYIGKELIGDVGRFDYNTTLFFFEYDVQLSHEDEIIEIVTDDTGEPVDPVQYIEKYSIKDIEFLRFENGRTEYIKVYASKAE